MLHSCKIGDVVPVTFKQAPQELHGHKFYVGSAAQAGITPLTDFFPPTAIGVPYAVVGGVWVVWCKDLTPNKGVNGAEAEDRLLLVAPAYMNRVAELTRAARARDAIVLEKGARIIALTPHVVMTVAITFDPNLYHGICEEFSGTVEFVGETLYSARRAAGEV